MSVRTLKDIEDNEAVIDEFGTVWLATGGWLLSWSEERGGFVHWGMKENVQDIRDEEAHPDDENPPVYGERRIQKARLATSPQWEAA